MANLLLYKYCGPRGLNILRSAAIYMTRAAAFNDPFDLRPHVSNAVRLTNPGGADYRVVLRNIEVRSTERALRIAKTVVLSLSENATSQMMWAH